MKDFIQNHPYIGRKESFIFAVEELLRRKNLYLLIVETGTIREELERKHVQCDGGSTFVWAELIKRYGGKFFSIDSYYEAVRRAKIWMKDYLEDFNKKTCDLYHFDIVFQNSLDWFAEFKKNIDSFERGTEKKSQLIDLLYLDSFDSFAGQEAAAAEYQLKEAERSLPLLDEYGLVLLDDHHQHGKTNLSLPFYLENDFKIINESCNQILLSRY